MANYLGDSANVLDYYGLAEVSQPSNRQDQFKSGKKAKILDYYTMMPESSDENLNHLTPAARQRIPIRGACNICRKPIRGSHRVKSNFICHLKRCHPEAYDEFEVLSGRKSALLSVASKDESATMNFIAAHHLEPNVAMSIRPTTTLPMPPPAHVHPISVSASSAAAYSAVTSAIKRETSMPSSPSNVLFPRDVKTSTPAAPSTHTHTPPVNAHTTAREAHAATVDMDVTAADDEMLGEALLDFVIENMLPLHLLETPSFKHLTMAIRRAKSNELLSAEQLEATIHSKSEERREMVREKLKGLTGYCISEEAYELSSCGKQCSTVCIHYIQDWTYNHLMVMSKEKDSVDETHQAVLAFRKSYKEFQPAAIDSVVCNLSQAQPLPGFLTMAAVPVLAPLEHNKGFHNSFTSEVGNAVLSALQDESQLRLVELINKASKLLLNKTLNWERDPHSAQEWFQQLNLLDLVIVQSEKARNECNSEDCLLDAAEMIELRNLLDILKPFQSVIEHFHTAGMKSCTGSFVVPYHRLLIQNLSELEVEHPTNAFLKRLCDCFLTRTHFVEEGNDKPTVYTTCTTLDPRFKLRWCEDKDYDMYKDHLDTIAKSNFRLKTEQVTTVNSNGHSSSIFAKILKQPLESCEDAAVATEVLRYLREPIIAEDSDVLGYWKKNELSFPVLSRLAVKYLPIPTSVSDIRDVRPGLSGAANRQLSGKLLEDIVELSVAVDDDY